MLEARQEGPEETSADAPAGGGLGRVPGRLYVVAYLFYKVTVVAVMIVFSTSFVFSFENQYEKLSIKSILIIEKSNEYY